MTTEGKIGRHINYGVREFGMAAIMNGVALHGGYIPYGGTFLTFSDYSRNAIRMAALMKRRVIHVFTHDSIGLGEDGPTHQSVEHAASLRLIPGLDVWRPADTTETTVAWTMALVQKHRPSALLLSRQNLPYLPKVDADVITQGAYVLAEPREVGLNKKAQVVLMATGSEVHLALQAQEQLAKLKIAARVVSVPSTSVFDRQTESYKVQVLPRNVPRVAIEAGVTDFWWKYRVDAVIGLDRFGESAPGAGPVQVLRHHGGQHRRRRAQGRRQVTLLRCGVESSRAVTRSRQTSLREPGIPYFETERHRHDHQDRHQRLRPHRAHGVPRGRAELLRHRDRCHQRPARARLPRLHAELRLGARPLQGRGRRSTTAR